jgi:hypothetical protein
MFVRRVSRGNEMDFVEMKPALRGARDGKVANVDGIERAAEERDPALACLPTGRTGILRRRHA